MTFLPLLALAALAAEPIPGRVTAYPIPEERSTGAIENFREVLVDADSFPATLEPVEIPHLPERVDGAPVIGPSFPALSTLPIANDTSSWAEVSVNGQVVGVIDPFTHGAIHDVRAGTYEVAFKLQNGFRETHAVNTLFVPPSEVIPPPVSPDAPVPPPPPPNDRTPDETPPDEAPPDEHAGDGSDAG